MSTATAGLGEHPPTELAGVSVLFEVHCRVVELDVGSVEASPTLPAHLETRIQEFCRK